MRLRFSSLDELTHYILEVTEVNHTTAKKWSAAQNFFHLAAAFEGSMLKLPAGYPSWIRIVLRPFRRVVTFISFPPFLPIPAATRKVLEPPKEAGFEDQKSRLLNAI